MPMSNMNLEGILTKILKQLSNPKTQITFNEGIILSLSKIAYSIDSLNTNVHKLNETIEKLGKQ